MERLQSRIFGVLWGGDLWGNLEPEGRLIEAKLKIAYPIN